MLAQKLFRVVLPIDRNTQRELRLFGSRGLNIRSSVQVSLKFRDEVQVIEDFVTFILPGGKGNRLRQQPPPTISVVTNPSRHSCQKSDGGSLEGILKKQSEIELSPAPISHLRPSRSQPCPIVNQNLINEVCVDKTLRRARPRYQRDVRVGQHAAQLAQGRHSHHCVANPVCAADDDTLDLIRM